MTTYFICVSLNVNQCPFARSHPSSFQTLQQTLLQFSYIRSEVLMLEIFITLIFVFSYKVLQGLEMQFTHLFAHE